MTSWVISSGLIRGEEHHPPHQVGAERTRLATHDGGSENHRLFIQSRAKLAGHCALDPDESYQGGHARNIRQRSSPNSAVEEYPLLFDSEVEYFGVQPLFEKGELVDEREE